MARWFKILFFLLLTNIVFNTLTALSVYSVGMEEISPLKNENLSNTFHPGDQNNPNWMKSLPTDPLNYLAGFVINGFKVLTDSIYSITIGAPQLYTNLLHLIAPPSPSNDAVILPIVTMLCLINYAIVFFGLIEFARGPVGMT